jgi:histidinol dehydrogenase
VRIVAAGTPECAGFLAALRGREGGIPAGVEAEVRAILEGVRARGDDALWEYARRFDGADLAPATLRVPEEERRAAGGLVPPAEREALALAAERIEAFHRRQRGKPWSFTEPDGTVLGQAIRPLRRVGIYVPGGRAAYPSTVLMAALPARVAGVDEVVLCTPCGADLQVHPAVLAAAELAGVSAVYRVGGAHAVAAMAYGTASLPRVDKIVGPGNVYVAAAKRLVFGAVGIDMIAGPTEVVVVADETARAEWVAADLLAQAEHDPVAAPIAVVTSRALAERVAAAAAAQGAALPRRAIAQEALARHGAVIVASGVGEALAVANAIAPEHLELMVADPWRWLPEVENAGAVFLGATTPEVAGDYLAGPNHVLPTGGTARFASPLSVEDFVKRTSFAALTPNAFRTLAPALARLARLEGLEGHARSAEVRCAEQES